MAGSLVSRIERAICELADLRDRLRPLRFARKIDERKQVTADAADRLERALKTRIEREQLILAGMKNSLEAQNPLAVLGRGYCIVEKKGSPVKSIASIAEQDRLDLKFSDGRSQVLVERVEHDRNV
jgi:exodeoxyribonuclease VII large subunit